MNLFQRTLTVLTMLLMAALAAAPAFGSAIIGRDVTGASLSIDHQGRGHVSYRSGGRDWYVVAWGAIDARAPSTGQAQVKSRPHYGLRGNGASLPYDETPLGWLVK